MKKTMRSFNNTLRTESLKRREARLSGAWKPKPRKPLRKVSAKQKERIDKWRNVAEEICTIGNHLYCPYCGKRILSFQNWEAHHWKEKRGNAGAGENDKYVVALHFWCHRAIDHNNPKEFENAKKIIEQTLKGWGKL